MNGPMRFADHLTVLSLLGEREFRDVYVEVVNGVLIIRRDDRELAWFADGQWSEVSFL